MRTALKDYPPRFLLLSVVFATCLPLLLFSQDAGNEPGGERTVALESEQAGRIDWGEELLKGEEISFVLILVAVTGLAYFIERLFSVRGTRFVSAKKAKLVREPWARGDLQAAAEAAERDSSIFGLAARYLTTHTHLSFEIVSFGASDIISRAVGRQLQRTYPLAIVATISPLLGLLGTIIGMIEAFQKVAIMGDTGDASVLADSIGKALITTAVGLIVAIPALAAYHFFKMKVNNLGIRIEEEIDEMLSAWLTPEPQTEAAEATQGDDFGEAEASPSTASK